MFEEVALGLEFGIALHLDHEGMVELRAHLVFEGAAFFGCDGCVLDGVDCVIVVVVVVVVVVVWIGG